jgi:Bacterial alpha-L-rhamnosidase.
VLCKVLSDYGYLDEAYMLLNRTEYPSWLYPVTKGATTIWERWDGIKSDDSFQSPSMNSFNHYAYGAIGEWMYSVVAGVRIDEQHPGYKHTFIHPEPGGGLTSAKASVHSMYGKVSSSWRIEGRKMLLQVEVPPNTSATLLLPDTELADVSEGGKPLTGRTDIPSPHQDGKMVSIDVGAGKYSFESLLKTANSN